MTSNDSWKYFFIASHFVDPYVAPVKFHCLDNTSLKSISFMFLRSVSITFMFEIKVKPQKNMIAASKWRQETVYQCCFRISQ